MSIEKVTYTEEVSLKNNLCPDCDGVEGFLQGPCGGGSVNVMCANSKCKARFNFCWPGTPDRLEYGLMHINKVLPPIADKDVPPMPKCKPPKSEFNERIVKIIEDNDGLQDASTNTYIRCPFGSIVMQNVHIKQGCSSDCAAFDGSGILNQGSDREQLIVRCRAGKFTIGLINTKEETL